MVVVMMMVMPMSYLNHNLRILLRRRINARKHKQHCKP